MAPWINLLFKKQAKAAVSDYFKHVGFWGEPHDEDRLDVKILAKLDLCKQLLPRNVVLRVLDFYAIRHVVSRDNAIEIVICLDPRFVVPGICVLGFSPETIAPQCCIKH